MPVAHLSCNQAVDASVWLPVWRTDPDKWQSTDIGNDGVDHRRTAAFHIAQKQLVASKAHHNVTRFEFFNICPQLMCRAPFFGCRPIPNHRVKRMPVFFGIGSQTRRQSFQHGVAYKEQRILARIGCGNVLFRHGNTSDGLTADFGRCLYLSHLMPENPQVVKR